MAVVSLPPAGPSARSEAFASDDSRALEAPCGLRPSAFAAALFTGGLVWYVLVALLIWAI